MTDIDKLTRLSCTLYVLSQGRVRPRWYEYQTSLLISSSGSGEKAPLPLGLGEAYSEVWFEGLRDLLMMPNLETAD